MDLTLRQELQTQSEVCLPGQIAHTNQACTQKSRRRRPLFSMCDYWAAVPPPPPPPVRSTDRKKPRREPSFDLPIQSSTSSHEQMRMFHSRSPGFSRKEGRRPGDFLLHFVQIPSSSRYNHKSQIHSICCTIMLYLTTVDTYPVETKFYLLHITYWQTPSKWLW